MKASGIAVLSALLLVGFCSTTQLNQERHQLEGYIPSEDRVITYQYDEK